MWDLLNKRGRPPFYYLLYIYVSLGTKCDLHTMGEKQAQVSTTDAMYNFIGKIIPCIIFTQQQHLVKLYQIGILLNTVVVAFLGVSFASQLQQTKTGSACPVVSQLRRDTNTDYLCLINTKVYLKSGMSGNLQLHMYTHY